MGLRRDWGDFFKLNSSNKMLHMGNPEYCNFKLFLLFLFTALITAGLSFIGKLHQGFQR